MTNHDRCLIFSLSSGSNIKVISTQIHLFNTIFFQRKRKSDIQNGFPCKKLLPESKTGCSTTSPRNKACSFLNRDNNSDKPKSIRTVIPTKDNIPLHMAKWLTQFQVISL